MGAKGSTPTTTTTAAKEEQQQQLCCKDDRDTAAAHAVLCTTADVLREVLSFVPPWQWPLLARVCRLWRSVARDDPLLWQRWTAAAFGAGWAAADRKGLSPRAFLLRVAKNNARWRLRAANELFAARSRRVRETSADDRFSGSIAFEEALPPFDAERVSLRAAIDKEHFPQLLRFELRCSEWREPNGPMGFRYDLHVRVRGVVVDADRWQAVLRPLQVHKSRSSTHGFDDDVAARVWFNIDASQLERKEDLRLHKFCASGDDDDDAGKRWDTAAQWDLSFGGVHLSFSR